MPIEQRHVDELKRIYRQQYGEGLSHKEAWEMAHRLVNLFKILLRSGEDDTAAAKDNGDRTAKT